MKVLIVEPGKAPRRADIPHQLGAMQHLVGGYIEAVYPFDDPVVLVCNEEGKLNGLTPNRHIPGSDIVVGTFFLCGMTEEDFTDLPDELAAKYEQLFSQPESFYRIPNGIVVVSEDGKKEVISL